MISEDQWREFKAQELYGLYVDAIKRVEENNKLCNALVNENKEITDRMARVERSMVETYTEFKDILDLVTMKMIDLKEQLNGAKK